MHDAPPSTRRRLAAIVISGAAITLASAGAATADGAHWGSPRLASNSWTGVLPGSNNWTGMLPGSNSWTGVQPGSNSWTGVSPNGLVRVAAGCDHQKCYS